MNWKTILHSAIVAGASVLGGAVEQYFQSGGVVPQSAAQWHSFLASVGATALIGVAALLKQSPLTKASIIAALLLLASPAMAQTAPMPLFTPASYAVYVHLDGTSNIASLTAETFNITPSWGAEAVELVTPSLNMQGYFGGIAYTPNLTALFKNTTLAANPPTLSFSVDAGEVMNTTPSAAKTGTGFMARSIFAFNVGGGISVPINVGYGRLPGFGASQNAFLLTAGLAKTFNLP